jgi:hypothetical protein
VAESKFPLAHADNVWADKERWYHYNFNLQRNNGDLRAGVARKRKTHNP